jgi:hypothetical protein
MREPTFTLDELETAAKVADKMLALTDYCVEEAEQTPGMKLHGVDAIEIKHGAWRIRERKFWSEVAARLRAVELCAEAPTNT